LLQVQAACLPGCICNEQEHWKTEELLLDHLQEVEITGLRGSQHEVTLLKQLFSWATVLKKIKVTFDPLMTESMAKELCEMLISFSRTETCMEFYMYNVIQLGVSSEADENNIRRFNY
jgi:acid stress-induced BolA-like protein IbaG/YrbA